MESGLGFYVEYVATIYRENMYVCTLSTEVPKAIKLHSFGSMYQMVFIGLIKILWK